MHQIKFVGAQYAAVHDVLNPLPGIWHVFRHDEAQKVRRISAKCFRECANAIERDFCGTSLEHGDDVGIVKSALAGNLALGFVRLSQAIGDEVANGSLGMCMFDQNVLRKSSKDSAR